MAATEEHYIFNCPIRGKIDCGTGKVGSDLRAALSREGGETAERKRLIDDVVPKQHKADDPPHVDDAEPETAKSSGNSPPITPNYDAMEIYVRTEWQCIPCHHYTFVNPKNPT